MGLIRNLFGKKSTAARKPPEPVREQRRELTAQAWLLALFHHHGLASTVHGDWVLPKGELPGIRGTWHPTETNGRLDMHVLVGDGVLIEECFAGIGAGDIGLADGLQNFTINSFHPLLSALWSEHDPEQVEIESWTAGDRRFSAFIGNVGTRSSTGVTPSIPADLLPRLEVAVRSEPLEEDLHWFRFYVANLKGDFTFEALKDNEPWPAGLTALASCGWEPCDAFYSARLFVVLRAAAAGVESEA